MVNGVKQLMPMQYDGDPLYLDSFNRPISVDNGCLLGAMNATEGYVRRLRPIGIRFSLRLKLSKVGGERSGKRQCSTAL
jgi:hypothetical protein